jgi:hypothetical protein
MNGEGFSSEEVRWSGAEKKIARSAFDKAYQRQCATILAKATKMLATASVPRDLWKVHDYLSVQRRATDKTYDYRYSVLLSVLAALIEENWLNVTDLAGLQESKIEKIEAWVKFRRDDRG